MEEEWRRVLQAAKEALDRAEVLEKELRAFETWKEGTWVWVKDQKQQLHSQSSQTKTEERLHTAQVCVQLEVLINPSKIWTYCCCQHSF